MGACGLARQTQSFPDAGHCTRGPILLPGGSETIPFFEESSRRSCLAAPHRGGGGWSRSVRVVRTIFSSPSRGERSVTSPQPARRRTAEDGATAKDRGPFFENRPPHPHHVTPKPSLQYACTRPISLPTPTKVQACPSTPREPKRAPAGLPSPASRVSGGVRARSSANAATASEPHPFRTARGLPNLPDAEGAYRAAIYR